MADKTALDEVVEIVRAALLAHVGPANACIVSSLTDTAFSALAEKGYSVVNSEWEYSYAFDSDHAKTADDYGPFNSAEAAHEDALARSYGEHDTYRVCRRRKVLPAGRWEPVPEGGEQQ